MAEIGNSSEELYIRFRNNIYLLNGSSGIINILNPDGSLNVKVKDIINYNSPFNSLENGFYYYDGSIYLKYNGEIIDLKSNNSLPEGAIIMYDGNTPPNGWNLYSTDTGFNNVIYIINKSGSTPDPVIPDKKTISFNWTGSILNGLRLTVTLGESFTTPTLSVSGVDDLTVFKKRYVSYSSSDETIATASKNSSGDLVLTPLKEGTTWIYARTDYDSEAESLYTSAERYFFLSVEEPTTGIITVDLRNIDLEYQATSINVGVTCDTSWGVDKIEFWSDDDTWCTATKLNNTTLKINVTENETDYNRVASIILSSDNYGATVTVILSGKPHITPDKQTVILNWTGSVETNETLNVTIGESFSTPNLKPKNEITGISWTEFKKRYIEYSSFDESIATVSKNSSGDLQLTIVGPGSTRILAETVYSGDALDLYTTDRSIFYLLVADSTPQPSEDIDSLDTIIDNFNSTGISPTIPKSGTVYTYLEDMYDTADSEYNDSNSKFFSSSNYPEIYDGNDYRGNNDEYELNGLAENAMLYWLIAMCVSELIPTKYNGSDYINGTNNQTKLFKKAFDLGKSDNYGKSIPLYGGYTLKGDPNICRLAASAIYASKRGNGSGLHSFSDINSYRSALGGSTIYTGGSFRNYTYLNDVNVDFVWDAIGCDYDDEKNASGDRVGRYLTKLGYAVNTNLIFPNTPGPEVSGSYAATKMEQPQNQGQPSSLFNSSTNNYLVDEAIDEYITDNYNMMDINYENDWNNYSIDKKNRLIRAAASMGCTFVSMFCADTKLTYTGTSVYLYGGYEYKTFNFSKNSSGDLTLSSPFGIHSKMWNYVNQCSDRTSVSLKFMMSLATCTADNMRFPTFCPNYGRRRPGDEQTLSPGPNGRGGSYANHLNELYNMDISAMVVDDGYILRKTGKDKEDGLSCLKPTSYPSGHSAQIWALALALTSVKPENVLTYLKGAYEYSVNRSICRCHWNSDVIYGRLFGTITLPIFYAVDAVINEGYPAFDNALGKEAKPSEVEPIGDSTSLIIKIVNNSSESVTLDNRVRFMFDDNGTPNRTNNIHFVHNGSISDNQMESMLLDPIPAGGSREYTIKTINFADNGDTTGLGKNFSSNPQGYRDDYLSNAILYVNGENLGDAVGKFPSTAILNFGYKYTLLYGGSGYVEPVVPDEDGIQYGKVNITLINNSGINFDGSSTSNGSITIQRVINTLLLPYTAGHISALIALKNNSILNDVMLDSNNNPPCRFEYFTINNGESKTFTNAWFKINSDDSKDFLPSSGKAFESLTNAKLYLGGNIQISNGDFGEFPPTNRNLNIAISGENGIFKNGGSYTVTIT